MYTFARFVWIALSRNEFDQVEQQFNGHGHDGEGEGGVVQVFSVQEDHARELVKVKLGSDVVHQVS
jgi:hypothetical protein